MIFVLICSISLNILQMPLCLGRPGYIGTRDTMELLGNPKCDPSARNESHVGSVQVEKMCNMQDMSK